MPFDLAGFGEEMLKLSVAVALETRLAIEEACVIVEHEAKRVIGTYDYGWVPLAQATIDDRSRQGFNPDEPLLRTGELRDSIQHTVIGLDGYVGSDNMKAVWQELGTKTIPPRSFLMGAAQHKVGEVVEKTGLAINAVMTGRKPVWEWAIGTP